MKKTGSTKSTGGNVYGKCPPSCTRQLGAVETRQLPARRPLPIVARPSSTALMKIIRYESADREIAWAEEHADGRRTRLRGDPLGGFAATTEPASVQRLLAPVVPAAFLCIGLNYRQHAAETKAPLPEFPVVFMKTPGAVQHPGE